MALKKLRNLLVFDYEEFFEPTNEVGQKEKAGIIIAIDTLNHGVISAIINNLT